MPWPFASVRASRAVVPVFMPFMGCPVRCIFCAQDVQTGGASLCLSQRLDAAREILQERSRQGLPPAELAFYGGTFTALPEPERDACLAFARAEMDSGRIAAFRCSTRPDCVDGPMLQHLQECGCHTVELGIQSFDDAALAATRRGYDRARALAACALIRGAGLALGVQLLPGMPGVDPAVFLSDVETALAAGAAMLRFYPCMVLEGTPLALWWREGRYTPWPLEQTIDVLSQGWLLSQRARVPVIRMGLAPEPSLEDVVLAGPQHPALGARVMARALYLAVTEANRRQARPRPLSTLEVPRPCQGYFWGHKGELRASWSALGVGPKQLRFTMGDIVRLCWTE